MDIIMDRQASIFHSQVFVVSGRWDGCSGWDLHIGAGSWSG